MDDKIRKILAGLHDEYITILPIRIATIETQWLELTSRTPDETTLKKYYREVHDLGGSTGSHGFQDLSKYLRKFDAILLLALTEGFDNINKNLVEQLLLQIKKASVQPPKTPLMFQG